MLLNLLCQHKATVRQRNQDGLKLRMYQVMKRHGKLVNGRNEEGHLKFLIHICLLLKKSATGMSLPDYQLLLEKLFVDRPSRMRLSDSSS